MKKLLISKETPASHILDIISKLREKEELKLILHEKINFTYDETRKITNLIKGLESKVHTFSIGNLDTKGFIFFVLCGTNKREISSNRSVKLNEDPDLMIFGITQIAKSIYEITGKYSKVKFIKDYNDQVTLDYSKLKKLGIISEIESKNSSEKKKTPKKVKPLKKAEDSDTQKNESMPEKSIEKSKKSNQNEVDTSNINVIDNEEQKD